MVVNALKQVKAFYFLLLKIITQNAFYGTNINEENKYIKGEQN